MPADHPSNSQRPKPPGTLSRLVPKSKAALLAAAAALARYAQVFIGVGCDTDVLVFCGRLASVIQ